MSLVFRQAAKEDLEDLVNLLADDDLGTLREDQSSPLNQRYVDAFEAISAHSGNELTVVEERGEIVGMLQLTFIPYLTHTGSWRCLIEGVRIASDHRGEGLGSKLLEWGNISGQRKGLQHGPVDFRQTTPGCVAILCCPWLCCEPRGVQAQVVEWNPTRIDLQWPPPALITLSGIVNPDSEADEPHQLVPHCLKRTVFWITMDPNNNARNFVCIRE